MKRENRANIWFLLIFLGLSLPGVVILVHRKYTTASAPALLYPDLMTNRLAYMVPLPVPPDSTFFVPPLTHHWVDSLEKDHHPASQTSAVFKLDERGDPIPFLSADHRVQVTGISDREPVISGIIWRESVELSHVRISASNKSIKLGEPGKMTAVVHELPQPVRQELMACGYPRPPKNVVWFECTFAKLISGWISGGVNVSVDAGESSTVDLSQQPTR